MRGRKTSAFKESRRLIVRARLARQRRRESSARTTEAREAEYRAALARVPGRTAQVDRVLASEPDEARARKLRELLDLLAERAPRLLSADLLPALKLVAQPEWVRPASDWQPAGKSRGRLFRGLAEHLLARYPMPAFLWTSFLAGEDAAALSAVAAHVAGGGSLYKAATSGLMPVPLTRKMCHELLTGGQGTFLAAVREVQVRAAGGDRRLVSAWTSSRAGRRLHPRPAEEFWQTVLAWLAVQPSLGLGDVSPLVDYIEHRRGQDGHFSMKGRTVRAMRRGMEAWHADLALGRLADGRTFEASGLRPMDIDRSRWNAAGQRVTEVWHFREILDGNTLVDEGRAMGHCVYSYADRIVSRECAIWTLTLEDDTGHWRRLTIEVRPSTKEIVQARGRFNRTPEAADLRALEAWAARNALEISLGRL